MQRMIRIARGHSWKKAVSDCSPLLASYPGLQHHHVEGLGTRLLPHLFIAVLTQGQVRVGHPPQTPHHCSAQLRTDHIQQTLTSKQLLHHTQPTHRQKEGNNWVQFCRAQLNLLHPFSPHQRAHIDRWGLDLTLLPYRVSHERGRNQDVFALHDIAQCEPSDENQPVEVFICAVQ